MSDHRPSAKLAKRLMPLYVAVFFQGFVLWYVIEKLFMREIGFDDAGIGIMAAVYAAVMLLVETPSGILADRWSRKGVLALASVALALSSLICGIAGNVPVYLVGAGLWGVFYALYSGVHEAIIYDTLLEQKYDTENYEKYYGRVKIVDSVALVLGALLGGVVAEQFGLRETFYWTIPSGAAAIVALLFLKEPELHKQQVAAPLGRHVRDTFGAVLRKGNLVFILTGSVILGAVAEGIYEFNQLWWIALAMPVIAYGPANALLLGTLGLGGAAAGYLRLHRYGVMQSTMAVMILCGLGLVLSRSAVVIVACQVVLGIGLIGLGVVFNRWLHDSLESRVRAGAASAVSTLTRLVFIPFSLLLGFISTSVDIFAASWIIVALLAVCVVVIARMFVRQGMEPVAVSQTDQPAMGEYKK